MAPAPRATDVMAQEPSVKQTGRMMATNGEPSAKLKEEESRPMLGLLCKTLLAAIGAAALAQEEMAELVNRLEERGETAEKEGRALVRDLTERRKRETANAEQRFDAQMEAALRRVNLPSKTDIERINANITELNDRLDQLDRS
jgi:polyhydroxyalkanoate synthesis regulator phasin